MQIGFITSLRRIVDAGENRALLISATGERVIIVILLGSAVNTWTLAA